MLSIINWVPLHTDCHSHLSIVLIGLQLDVKSKVIQSAILKDSVGWYINPIALGRAKTL